MKEKNHTLLDLILEVNCRASLSADYRGVLGADEYGAHYSVLYCQKSNPLYCQVALTSRLHY